MPKIKPTKIGLKLLSFRIHGFQYLEPKEEYRRAQKGSYNFQSSAEIDIEKGNIHIKLKAKLKVGPESDTQKVAVIDTESIFRVKNLKRFQHDDKGIELPSNFIPTLAAMHYAATRGALVAKGAGTVIERIPLPLIDTSKLLIQPEDKMPK